MTSTSEIYGQIILENIIKKYLRRGEVPTLAQIEEEFTAAAASQDLNSSDFTSTEWSVERKEHGSAAKFNGMSDEIAQDINVLYKSLYSNSEHAVELFTRWQNKANALENRLRALESRITRLLVVNNGTSGYFDAIGDKFTNTKFVDLDRSTNVAFNLSQNIVTLDKPNTIDSSDPDRIFLNNLTNSQVVFNSITRNNVVSVNNIDRTEPRFAFRDQNQFWKTHVIANQAISPVVTELILQLDEEITISRIDVFLHSSQNNALTRITPLFSTDGINYTRVPGINTVGEGLDKITFQFPETDLTYLKLIIEKDVYDFIQNGLFIYEFGAREIGLYQEGFLSGDSFVGTLISKPFSIIKPDKTLVKFNTFNLEVCEGISSESRLDYFVSVAKDSNGTPNWLVASGFSTSIEDEDGNDQRLWYPITPEGREESVHPKIIDLSSISINSFNEIGISFDRDAADQISPAADFTLLETIDGSINTSNETSTEQRYVFAKNTHKLLNIQLNTESEIDLNSLTLWRNIGEKGISIGDTSKLVRKVQIGWEYNAPFYSTVILIKGSDGLTINVGNNPIQIDNVTYRNVIDGSILSPGIHRIKVHKDYWNPIEPNLESLDVLKAKDILYPFNQKLLIEGYQYSDSYPETDEQIYVGVDRFAGILCEQVSIFDMINNISEIDYGKFALDIDIKDASPINPSRVFIVNCNNTIADFMNETFILDFNLTDQLFSYLAFKAEFRTTNSKLTPILDEYTIKLGF